ncbi:hypothetical protein G6038_23230 [Rhodococcus sp. 14C212]|nr:hypothetical protein [Rhodococcus sp. 14C212]
MGLVDTEDGHRLGFVVEGGVDDGDGDGDGDDPIVDGVPRHRYSAAATERSSLRTTAPIIVFARGVTRVREGCRAPVR